MDSLQYVVGQHACITYYDIIERTRKVYSGTITHVNQYVVRVENEFGVDYIPRKHIIR